MDVIDCQIFTKQSWNKETILDLIITKCPHRIIEYNTNKMVLEK